MEEHHGGEVERAILLIRAEPGPRATLAEETKSRYKFSYGDFENVHRCGVIAAEVRSGQRKYTDIEVAAAHLHGMLDELM
jgi:hypothetical protein